MGAGIAIPAPMQAIPAPMQAILGHILNFQAKSMNFCLFTNDIPIIECFEEFKL